MGQRARNTGKKGSNGSEIGLDGIDELLVLGVGEIDLPGIHLEDSAIIGTIDILRCEVEMEVAELVAVSAVIDFLRIEGALHGTCGLSYVGHEVVALLVVELVEVIDVVVVADEATSAIGLFLEKEETGNTQVAYLDHEIMQGLVVGAIETVFWIAVHRIGKCFRVG